MEAKFESMNNALEKYNHQPARQLIQRVPHIFGEHKNFKRNFVPRVMSIGPLHHGSDKLKPMEEVKLRLAAQFILESRQNEYFLFEEIARMIKELRNCYEDRVVQVYGDQDLAWMLFVDGCALLQFISLASDEKKLDDLNIKKDIALFTKHDLFLLENQLPYQVLDSLMNKSLADSKQLKKSINHFISNNMLTEPSDDVLRMLDSNTERAPQLDVSSKLHSIAKPVHLLDLLRSVLLCSLGQSTPQQCSRSNDPLRAGTEQNYLPIITHNKQPEQKASSTTFRNIKELKAAGIRVVKSRTSCLKDISFKQKFCTGDLMLPRIKVDDSTGPMLLNLAAYEMCPDLKNDFGISSYICFMDSLVDHPEDVKELRNAQILRNLLGSDEEVANLFNEISTDLVQNPHIYWGVKNDLQSHFKKVHYTWVAQFLHDHFNSPWSVLAFLGVIAGLILSLLQVIYSKK